MIRRLSMGMDNPKGFFWSFTLVLVGGLMFLGGLGVDKAFSVGQTGLRVEVLKTGGVLIAALLTGLAFIVKGGLRMPRGAFLYGLFLILFLMTSSPHLSAGFPLKEDVATAFNSSPDLKSGVFLNAVINTFGQSRDATRSFEVFMLFLSGGLFWLAFYNLASEFGPRFDKAIIILGLIFGGMFIAKGTFSQSSLGPWSLYLPSSLNYNHNHIGDFWAVVLAIKAYHMLKKPRWWGWVLIGVGFYFLVVSLSRAAYVAFAAGISYLFYKEGWIKRYKNLFLLMVVAFIVLFLSAGFYKTTLFSRPYFLQGILGIIHNPLGVGVGNFGAISAAPENQFLGIQGGFSSVAHNIVLEVMVGMGIFGIVFIIWLAKAAWGFWEERSSSTLIYQAVFITLFINFLFDYTYFIPTTLWLWFASLGLAQNRVRDKRTANL